MNVRFCGKTPFPIDSCGMHMGMRMAHVVWKHMGMRMTHAAWKHMGTRMNYMGMRMSGATISMAEWAALVVGPACKHYHAKRNDG